MSEVFISFIHEEEKIAGALQRFIRGKLGKDPQVFLSSDQWQIFAGEIWLDRIREELNSAKVVILMLSNESVARPWVNFEAGAAWLTGKAIIPVCYGALLKDQLPKPYSGIQALNLEKESYYLITSICRHLERLSPPPMLPDKDELFQDLKRALDDYGKYKIVLKG
jgi:hypothetical protein